MGFIVVVLIWALVGCGPPAPIPLDFATHGSVLRGRWTGTIPGYPTPSQQTTFTMNLDALRVTTWNSARQKWSLYSVTGSFQIPGQAAHSVSGIVYSDVYRYVSPQTPPPPPKLVSLEAEVVADNGKKQWLVNAWTYGESPDFSSGWYEGLMADQNAPINDPRSYSFVLRKAP